MTIGTPYLFHLKSLPLSKSIKFEVVDGEVCQSPSESFYTKLKNFPVLYSSQDEIVIPVVSWFFYLALHQHQKSIHAPANALLFYWRFLAQQNIIWDRFGYARHEKPTYLFHDALQDAANQNIIAKSTACSYMNYVLAFYRWAMVRRLFDFDELRAPFQFRQQTIKSIKSPTRARFHIVVESTDLSIKAPRAQKGARLRRLEREELKILGESVLSEPTAFRLMVYLALSTGMREEEICTLKEYQIDSWLLDKADKAQQAIELPIGPGSAGNNLNSNSTKGDKLRKVEMPVWLVDALCRYKASSGRLSRRELFLKKSPNLSNEIPLFLSQRGNGFSTASLRTLWCAFRSRLSNQYEIPFSYKFHDLRATYASYALMRLRALFQGHDYKAIEVLKSWMGHEDDRTLWTYITLLDADIALRIISLARENEIESYLNTTGRLDA